MGYKIKKRREELRMTQKELAIKSNVSRATISSLENGHGNTSTKTLKKIAVALETTIGELFFADSV